MYWYEKLDLLKKAVAPGTFRDPYRAGSGIIEKIYRRLIRCSSIQLQESTAYAALLKDRQLIIRCNIDELYEKFNLAELTDETWYFLLLIKLPMGPNFAVYDCRLSAIKLLVGLASSNPDRIQEFFIADKKYAWILYFRLNFNTREARVYKQFASQNDKNPEK